MSNAGRRGEALHQPGDREEPRPPHPRQARGGHAHASGCDCASRSDHRLEPDCSSRRSRRRRFSSLAALALGSHPLTLAGLGVAIAIAGIVAASLIVTERRRHEAAERELTSEARFLEALVETMGSIVGGADVIERDAPGGGAAVRGARTTAPRPGERPRSRTGGERDRDSAARARRGDRCAASDPSDVPSIARTSCARPCSRTSPRASTRTRQLLDDAQVREAERSRLSDQLITAEQDERRRLAQTSCTTAPVQSLSGVALLLDAGLNSIAGGPRRRRRSRSSAGRSSATARRSASCATSPSTSSPSSCATRASAPAVRALTDQIELAHNVAGRGRRRRSRAARPADAGRDLPDHPRGGRPGSATRPPQTLSVTDAARRPTASVETAIAGRRARRAPPPQPRRARGAGADARTASDGRPGRRASARRSASSCRRTPRPVRPCPGQSLHAARRALSRAWHRTSPVRMRGRWRDRRQSTSSSSGSPAATSSARPTASAPAVGSEVESDEREAAGDQGRALAAPARPAALRVPTGRLARTPRRSGRTRARPPARSRNHRSRCRPHRRPRANRSLGADDPRLLVDAQAADRVRDAGRAHAPRRGHPAASANGSSGRVDPRRGKRHDVGDRSLANRAVRARASSRTYHARASGCCAVACTRSFSDHETSPLEELLAAFVVDARVPAVELRERDELLLGEGRVRHVAAVELVQPGGELGAAGRPRAQAVAAAPRIRPQSQRRRPDGCARRRGSASPWKPPVARIVGLRLRSPPRRTSPASARRASRSGRADRSACRSVRGLPVSCSTTGAPSDSSHAMPVVELLPDDALQRSSPAGHSARKSSHSRKRQMTQLDSSIEPPGTRSFLVARRAPRRARVRGPRRTARPCPRPR